MPKQPPLLITTRQTLRRDLELSLGQGIVISTVGHFVEALLRQGVSLTDELSSIEYGVGQNGTGRVRVARDDDGRLLVTEIYR